LSEEKKKKKKKKKKKRGRRRKEKEEEEDNTSPSTRERDGLISMVDRAPGNGVGAVDAAFLPTLE